MSDFDHCDLDGHLLQLLVAVHEEASITRAAQRLGVTQSAVSHLLDKLRQIVGDPLFIRSGRGIVATARADALAQRARLLLDDLRGFVSTGGFDPATCTATVTVAANDLQADLLLPAALDALRRQAPGLTLRVIPSGVPRPELLRDGECQLILSPRPPEAGDLMQTRLFEDRYVIYFDAGCRAAPVSLADWLAADHVTVLYTPRRTLEVDQWCHDQGLARRIVASVPGFSSIAAFLRGSERLATLPALLGPGQLRGLASTALPFDSPPLPMYLIWHARHQADPMHQWLRSTLQRAVPAGLRAAGANAGSGGA